MNDTIYISQHINSINKDIVIEGDKHSVWAYLLDPENENQIVLDGFICSKGTIVDSMEIIKDFISEGFAPPLCKDFINDYSIRNDLKEDDIQILISKDSIDIRIADVKYLSMDFNKLKSYSKAISNAGPYGFPITELS